MKREFYKNIKIIKIAFHDHVALGGVVDLCHAKTCLHSRFTDKSLINLACQLAGGSICPKLTLSFQ